jgi:hypothetical protein
MVTAEDWRRHLKGDMGSNLWASRSPGTLPYPTLGSQVGVAPTGRNRGQGRAQESLAGQCGRLEGFCSARYRAV